MEAKRQGVVVRPKKKSRKLKVKKSPKKKGVRTVRTRNLMRQDESNARPASIENVRTPAPGRVEKLVAQPVREESAEN